MSKQNTLTRRSVLIGSAGAVGLGLIAACSGGDDGGDSPSDLTMWTFLDPAGTSGREKVLASLIASYEEANPGVKVNVEVQQWDTMTQQFLAADVAGNAPDVIWVALDNVADAAEQGALANLNEYAFGDLPEDQLAELHDVYWETLAQDGEAYGVVHSRNYIGILYRKDLLAEAGVDPEGIETWDDLIEAATALTDPAANRWGLGQAFATSFADPQIFSARLMETQGSLYNDDGSANWTSAEAVEAMDFQAAFVKDSKVTAEDAVRLTAEDLYELFSAGQVAMINGASVRVPAMQEQLGAENVGFMHYPADEAGSHAPGFLAGWSVGVWAGGESVEQATQFVAHLSSPEADELWMREAQQPPLYPSTATANADFLAEPENAFLAVVQEGAQEYGWLSPAGASTAGWKETLNTAVQEVLLGESSSAEALEAAQTSFSAGANG